MSITKGEWKPLKQKFITEYTDNGYLKIIFGAGANSGQEDKTTDAITDFSKYQISKMINNETKSIRYENIETLCLLLNCTPNELFDITEE